MEAKEYNINTLQDMLDCTTEENLDNFLVDLKTYLKSARMMKNIVELVGESENVKNICEDGFTWIDDGEHKSTINVRVKK